MISSQVVSQPSIGHPAQRLSRQRFSALALIHRRQIGSPSVRLLGSTGGADGGGGEDAARQGGVHPPQIRRQRPAGLAPPLCPRTAAVTNLPVGPRPKTLPIRPSVACTKR